MSESGRGQPPRHGHDGGLLDVPAHALEFSAVKPDAAAPRAAVDHEHVRGFLDHLGTVDGASLELFMRSFHHQPHLFHAGLTNRLVVLLVTNEGVQEWSEEMNKFSSLGPCHLSMYKH